MDPGEVPDELRELTEVEEMLVAQVFLMMSVYRLHGMLRHLSLLDVLVIHHKSASNMEAFSDFKVCHINEDVDYDENENDVITRTFVPLPPSANQKDTEYKMKIIQECGHK
ncbi:hypothetical protein RhiirA5_427029 [Rhizophagus irregularis]|uniref:DUF6570 domain-containing protein n=1 Tax=Rhizophagus irregularis TaxID=588596 RepID=A0A2N0P347_9GLOM|nr:hypothetical protein RhiirA5_427029 [Rhizophagus irregularis]